MSATSLFKLIQSAIVSEAADLKIPTEQWQMEIRERIGMDAVLIRSNTQDRLDREIGGDTSEDLAEVRREQIDAMKATDQLRNQFDLLAEDRCKDLVESHERFCQLVETRRYQVVHPVLSMNLRVVLLNSNDLRNFASWSQSV